MNSAPQTNHGVITLQIIARGSPLCAVLRVTRRERHRSRKSSTWAPSAAKHDDGQKKRQYHALADRLHRARWSDQALPCYRLFPMKLADELSVQ
jgi:hypothetical protein